MFRGKIRIKLNNVLGKIRIYNEKCFRKNQNFPRKMFPEKSEFN